MENQHWKVWTTEDELEYIDNIGNHSVSIFVTQIPRRELLRGYLKGLNRRTDWGNIDKKIIIRETVKALRAER